MNNFNEQLQRLYREINLGKAGKPVKQVKDISNSDLVNENEQAYRNNTIKLLPRVVNELVTKCQDESCGIKTQELVNLLGKITTLLDKYKDSPDSIIEPDTEKNETDL